MSNLFLRIILLASLLLLSSCTADFGVINTNPNSPEDARPELLLPGLITTLGERQAQLGWNNGNLVTQLTAKNNFTGFDRYLWGSNEGLWDDAYRVMRDAQTLQELGQETGNANYEGVALILKSFAAALLTDTFGDVPYSEAVDGKTEANFTPAYDPQQLIYEGLLADLSRANDLLDASGPPIEGDVLYGGDALKWRKLANSLRLRYLMRSSGRVDVSATMQQIISNEPVFESNDDDAALQYLSTAPNQFFMHTARVGGFDEHRMSRTVEQALKSTDDPRLEVWFRPLENQDSAGVYRGMPNGLSEGAAYDYNGGSQANISRLGRLFREQPDGAHGIIMTYSELQFVLAEAALKGFISADPAEHYLNGIQASMAFYNVDPGADFYTQPEIAFNIGTGLEQIMEQKWLSLFMTGLEGWSNWRRTGLPALEPAVDNVNNNRIPVRFLYPDSEQTLNTANYQEVISRQGPDDINTPVWWDVTQL